MFRNTPLEFIKAPKIKQKQSTKAIATWWAINSIILFLHFV